MVISVKRFQSMVKSRAFLYIRCGAKTATFLFWTFLYMLVMKMTVFKSSVNTPVKDWSALPDNYTKWHWQLQGPVISDDETEQNNDDIVWTQPDNATLREFQKRVETVHNVCARRSLFTQPLNSKEFFIDKDNGLVWCNIFKAASSAWLYNFNILGGYTKKFLARSKQAPLMLARAKYPRPNPTELRDAMKTPGVLSLLVVREPFVRLLSAYRDKLGNRIQPYYRRLAKSIVSSYRKSAVALIGQNKKFTGPTFYEFVRYLIDQYNDRTKDVQLNEHWAPYYQFCSPCAANFTMIAKVETLERDSMYVIQQLGLESLLDVKFNDRRLRTVMNKSRDGKNTTTVLKHYFSELDENLLNDLLKIYGTDFEMFGYDANVYKSYVKNNKVLTD